MLFSITYKKKIVCTHYCTLDLYIIYHTVMEAWFYEASNWRASVMQHHELTVKYDIYGVESMVQLFQQRPFHALSDTI